MISARGIFKSYSHHPVLTGLDLEVKPGELLVLLGVNGAGKTTLVRILATLTRPDAGRINIAGFSAHKEGREVRQRIGVVLHHSMLYGELTAYENLAFFARYYGLTDIRQRCEAGLEQAGLEHERDQQVRQFSRGMQQRLALARATLHDPDVLLLDEPFTGLDRAHEVRLQRSLTQLCANGKTILMTEHSFERALQMNGRVDVLSAGRIVESRPACEFSLVDLNRLFDQLPEEREFASEDGDD